MAREAMPVSGGRSSSHTGAVTPKPSSGKQSPTKPSPNKASPAKSSSPALASLLSRTRLQRTPKKDLRHLDSRSGVRAALKVEKHDSRWNVAPRFDKPPSVCYTDRAKPCSGTSNDETDNVLADVLYGRPVSATELRKIRQNRQVLRQHTGPRSCHQFFVASFQQKEPQDDAPTRVQVARRVLLSSEPPRPEPVSAVREQPWFKQAGSQVDGASMADASGLASARAHTDTPAKPTPRTPNGSFTAAQGLSSAIQHNTPKASEFSPGVDMPSHSATTGNASASRPGIRASASDTRISTSHQHFSWPKTSGKPPPSATSMLSVENLRMHDRSAEATPRSSAAGSAAGSSRRGGKHAREASSRASSRHSGSRGPSSARSVGGRSDISVASAPLRQVDWNNVEAMAVEQGTPHRRALSADVRPAGSASSVDGASGHRRIRGVGEYSDRHADVKDLFVPSVSQSPYRRVRCSGAPPPQKIQGVFDRDVVLASPSPSPYRRMRSARGTPPREKICMPLGAQGHMNIPERFFPAPWNPLAAKTEARPPLFSPP